MPKLITRSVFTTTIVALRTKFVEGKLEAEELEPITVPDVQIADEAVAMKHVQKKYGKVGQYAIKEMAITSKTYGLPLDFFMANAKEIVKKEAEAEGTEKASEEYGTEKASAE